MVFLKLPFKLFLGLDWQLQAFNRYGVWSRTSICTIWRNMLRYSLSSIFFPFYFPCFLFTLFWHLIPRFLLVSNWIFCRRYILSDGVPLDQAQTILISSYCWQGTCALISHLLSYLVVQTGLKLHKFGTICIPWLGSNNFWSVGPPSH